MKNYVVKKSKIDGLGIHANKNFKNKELIGHLVDIVDQQEPDHEYFTTNISPFTKTFIKRTKLERYLNHNSPGNSVLVPLNNKIFLFAKKDIKKGEEITVDYRHAFEVLDDAQIMFNIEK